MILTAPSTRGVPAEAPLAAAPEDWTVIVLASALTLQLRAFKVVSFISASVATDPMYILLHPVIVAVAVLVSFALAICADGQLLPRFVTGIAPAV